MDEGKVLHEPEFSLSEGAIRGWDSSHRYHFHLIRCLSKQYDFSLDEPFINLDPLVQSKVREWLKEYVEKGGTVFINTHLLENAERLCDRAAIIHQGKIQSLITLKDLRTADGSSPTLTLQSGDTDIAQDDVLGTINFQAPDEGTGTDAILVAAGIDALSEGDFSTSNNATRLRFLTAASETASEKMSLSSAGLLTIADDLVIKSSGTVGGANDPDLLTLGNGTLTVAGNISVTGADVTITGSISNTSLTTAQLSSHSHSIEQAPESFHPNAMNNTPFPQDTNGRGEVDNNTLNAGSGTGHNHSHTLSGTLTGNITTSLTGAVTAAGTNSFSPFVVVNYIIKH